MRDAAFEVIADQIWEEARHWREVQGAICEAMGRCVCGTLLVQEMRGRCATCDFLVPIELERCPFVGCGDAVPQRLGRCCYCGSVWDLSRQDHRDALNLAANAWDTIPTLEGPVRATLYDIIVAKLISMFKDASSARRHFAAIALPQICQRQDLRILLALRKVLEDGTQDASTRVLAAQAMLLIDAQDVGVQTAIRSVLASCNADAEAPDVGNGKASLNANQPRSMHTATASSMPAMPLGPSAYLLSSRLAMILSSAPEIFPPDQAGKYPAAIPLMPGADPGEGGGGGGGSSAQYRAGEAAGAGRAALKKKVFHVPRSLSKTGRSLDEVAHIRRKPRTPI